MPFLSGAPLQRKILDPPMKGMINGGTVTPNAYLPGHIWYPYHSLCFKLVSTDRVSSQYNMRSELL